MASNVGGEDHQSANETNIPTNNTASKNSSEEQEKTEGNSSDGEKQPKGIHRGWRFWAIFPALSVTALLSAVEATVVSTAMPTIVAELNMGPNYVWVINAFLLTRFLQLPLPRPAWSDLLRDTDLAQSSLSTIVWPTGRHFWKKMAHDYIRRTVCKSASPEKLPLDKEKDGSTMLT